MNNSTSFQGLLRLLLLATAIAGCINLAADHHAQNQGARTETSTRYDKDGTLVTTQTDYDAQNRVVETRELKGGKLRKRTRFTWPNGFKKPNASTTEYHPDGTTPSSTTNSDVDKDGNPTSTVTTNYDEKGKEISGTKRERDATGKEHCYNWNPGKQVYEEIECTQKPWVSSVGDDNVKVETGGGLIKINFNVEGGRVIVNLPDDMMAGDTISGTVVAEPKGETKEERERNTNKIADATFVVTNAGNTSESYRVKLVGDTPSSGPVQLIVTKVTFTVPATFRCSLQEESQNVVQTTLDVPPRISGGEFLEPPNQGTIPPFLWLPMGQQGRPIEIHGPFDGNSSNTSLNWSTGVPDFEKNTENVSGGFGLIAESPRKAVFRAPINVVGPIELILKEGSVETKGTDRNVGVNLSAPKTNLMKGESTTVTVQVQGLQGITEAVPLHLTKIGVVAMQGGDSQTMSIKPSDVQSNGTYTTTRTITGRQTGGFSVTATVVTFDTCLEDDGDPLRVLLFNVATGDFVFCQGRGDRAEQSGMSLSTFELLHDYSGGVRVPAGEAIDVRPKPGAVSIGPGESVTRDGTITMADFNFAGGRVQAQVDWSKHTGSATVQLTNPKQRFTITDRDTRNNTCTCK